jgi:hypothetical protein
MNTPPAPDLVPALDPMALPGPPWLFHVLLVMTFALHVVFMNLTLGGTLLAAISQIFSRGQEGDYRTVLAGRLMAINTYGIALTITTGVAPLLFIQLLFGQYFYTATLLLSWIWVAFLVLLIVGYYSTYLYKWRGAPTQGSGGTVWLVLSSLMFLLVAMVHVAVSLVHAQPDTWAAVAANPWSILGDRTYVVRLLHFVLASIAMSALVVAWWAVRRARVGEDVELNTKIASYAWMWALLATAVEFADGFMLLLLLPQRVIIGLMAGGGATMGPLALSIALAMGLLTLLSQIREPVEKPRLVSVALILFLLVVVAMSVTRHQVRILYLEPVTSGFTLESAPQWGSFLFFVALLALGLVTVAYMLRQVLTHPASGAEAA